MRSQNIWKKNDDKFYSPATAKTGDIITFKTDVRQIAKEFNGEQKTMVEVTIEVNGKEKIYTINRTSFKAMEEAFGDSANWIGKSASVFVAPTPKGDRKMILLDPIVDLEKSHIKKEHQEEVPF
jgi:hypothetical protein